jgi:hypothetical protein
MLHPKRLNEHFYPPCSKEVVRIGQGEQALQEEGRTTTMTHHALLLINLIGTFSAIGLSFWAAVLWFLATIVRVADDPNSHNFKIVDVNESTGNRTDVLKTAEKQVRWNRWAAAVTGLAAFAQGGATITAYALQYSN